MTEKRHFLHIQNLWPDVSMIFLIVAKVFYVQFCVFYYWLFSYVQYGFKIIGYYYILNYILTLKNFKAPWLGGSVGATILYTKRLQVRY